MIYLKSYGLMKHSVYAQNGTFVSVCSVCKCAMCACVCERVCVCMRARAHVCVRCVYMHLIE